MSSVEFTPFIDEYNLSWFYSARYKSKLFLTSSIVHRQAHACCEIYYASSVLLLCSSTFSIFLFKLGQVICLTKRSSKQFMSLPWGLFEGFRADATEVALPSDKVVEHFNTIEDIPLDHVLGLIFIYLMHSFWSKLKNDSATTLSQQEPRRHILGAR